MINNVYIYNRLINNDDQLRSLFEERYTELIRISDIEDPEAFIKEKAEQPQQRNFVIWFDTEPSKQNINWLVRYSFLPSYFKKENTIYVFAEPESAEKVYAAFTGQGFPAISLLTSNTISTFTLDNLSGYVIPDLNSLTTDLIITRSLEKQNAGVACSYTYDNLKLFLLQEPDLIKQLKKVTLEKEQLATKATDLSTELDNHKKYLEIALKQKETERILEFYHQEYEALPLWYKRFGHLIKIVTRKRKLRR
jgi:hypothetical protein